MSTPTSAMPRARIRKARRITGKTLAFRDVEVEDAPFILTLRTDPKKSRYLSATSRDLADQQSWLQRYADSTDQAYFIIEHSGAPIGTVRLYDAREESFSWGSWILIDGCPSHAAVESSLMVYSYAVDYLGFNACHFDVRKGNQRVWRFHERFGAKRTAETVLDYYYSLDLPTIRASLKRYAKFLPASVVVSE